MAGLWQSTMPSFHHISPTTHTPFLLSCRSRCWRRESVQWTSWRVPSWPHSSSETPSRLRYDKLYVMGSFYSGECGDRTPSVDCRLPPYAFPWHLLSLGTQIVWATPIFRVHDSFILSVRRSENGVNQTSAVSLQSPRHVLPSCAVRSCVPVGQMWGGATFDVCYRFLHEDPWERLRKIRAAAPNICLQVRQTSCVCVCVCVWVCVPPPVCLLFFLQ